MTNSRDYLLNALYDIRKEIIRLNWLYFDCKNRSKSDFHTYSSHASFFFPLEYLFSIVAEYGISHNIITLNDIIGDMDDKDIIYMIEGPLRLFVYT